MQFLRLAMPVSCLVAAFALESLAHHAHDAAENAKHVALSMVSETPGVNPPLAPKDDKQFFKTDYPHDARPTIDAKKFSAPYPKLQSNQKYESDYVKDENNDGGHWKAQMDYDTLKLKYAKQQEEVKKAKANEMAEHKEAKDADENAQAKATAAEAEAAAAQKESEAAEKDLAKAEQDSKAEGTAGEHTKKSEAVVAAEKRVEQAAANLVNCEKNLEDARKALKAQKGKEAARDGNENAQNQNLANEKAAMVDEAEQKSAAADKEAAMAKAEAAKQRREHAAAQEAFKKEKNEFEKVKSDYEKAEDELRSLRGEPPLKREKAENGEEAEKSSALQQPRLMTTLAVCAFATLYVTSSI